MNKQSQSDDRTALELLDLIPQMMQAIRREMRSARAPELSIPEFRTLVYLGGHDGTSLSGVAEHIGLMLPAASRIIDYLVMDKLATRETDPNDRRRIALQLTPRGRRKLEMTRKMTHDAFASRLALLTPAELEDLRAGVTILKRIFTEKKETPSTGQA